MPTTKKASRGSGWLFSFQASSIYARKRRNEKSHNRALREWLFVVVPPPTLGSAKRSGANPAFMLASEGMKKAKAERSEDGFLWLYRPPKRISEAKRS